MTEYLHLLDFFSQWNKHAFWGKHRSRRKCSDRYFMFWYLFKAVCGLVKEAFNNVRLLSITVFAIWKMEKQEHRFRGLDCRVSFNTRTSIHWDFICSQSMGSEQRSAGIKSDSRKPRVYLNVIVSIGPLLIHWFSILAMPPKPGNIDQPK